MILSPEIITIYILNTIFLFFGAIALYLSIKLAKGYDVDAITQKQYKLEKQSYLASTIIKYILFLKIPLLLFFIFTLDKLSNVLSGAMCGAGVLDATQYGHFLVILKIINIYLFVFWLVLNSEDLKYEKQPYVKSKFLFFIGLFVLLLVEIILEFDMFNSFEIDKLVSCCGSLYSSSSDTIMANIFTINTSLLLSVFYTNFIFLILFYIYKQKYIFTILNIVFFPISIISLILFFGTYIYELPSHNCPFCYLQSDYYYIGYVIYTFLFLGTFYGVIISFKDDVKNYRKSIIFNTLFVVIVSLYVVIYYIKNGVFL